MKYVKPDMNSLFLRGVPIRDAVDILSRWETITYVELERLGLTELASEQYWPTPTMMTKSLMN